MKKNLIKFYPNRPGLNKSSPDVPRPTSKTMPEWYRKADRFWKDPATNEFWENPDGSGKVPTWKACPAIFDTLTTGYVLVTPCDITFYLNENEKISVRVSDKNYEGFCTERPPMPQFVHPMGFYEDHFAWFPDWAPGLPEGYSAVWTHPLNRFDLPFYMTSGIIDNDKVNLPGTMPFFIAKGFEGTIPRGTPFAQIIPFQREDWESEVVELEYNSIFERIKKNIAFYRIKDGGAYKNKVWSPRKYE